MKDKYKALESAVLTVLYGVKPLETGTDIAPAKSVVETWRIKHLGEALRAVNQSKGDITEPK